MNTPTGGALAVLDRVISGVVDDPIRERRGHRENLVAVRSSVAELIEAAGKAQDTNRDDYVLGRPDVSHLPEAERAVFLRGWDAASEAVYRTGLRAALARVGGGA